MDLTEVATDELVKEIERRLACLTKEEKRVVLIGNMTPDVRS
jgi:hypothetical protein